MIRQEQDGRHGRRGQAQRHHQHLLEVGPGDRLGAAERRVRDRQAAHDGGRQPVRPSEDHGEHHGRRVERDAHRQPALQQEDAADQRADTAVEPAFQVLVRGIDVRARGTAEPPYTQRIAIAIGSPK